MRIPSSSSLEEPEPSNSQEEAAGILEKAKNLFHGKLSIVELQTVMDVLTRNGHGDCVQLILDELDPDLITNLVIHAFTHSAVQYNNSNCFESDRSEFKELQAPEEKTSVKKLDTAGSKTSPVNVEMQGSGTELGENLSQSPQSFVVWTLNSTDFFGLG